MGCTKSCYNNKEPANMNPPLYKAEDKEVKEVITAEPLNTVTVLKRPPCDTLQEVTLEPSITPEMLKEITTFKSIELDTVLITDTQIGRACINNTCTATYNGPESNNEICNHHSGEPIFQENTMCWSCCQKKTTDYITFLQQPTCTQGQHLWISKTTRKKKVCTFHWYQSDAFIVIIILAKRYLPYIFSKVKVNSTRLIMDLSFPEDNSRYFRDLDLEGIISVTDSNVNMYCNRVEITLKKAVLGFWEKLHIPRGSKTIIDSP